jgi:hypothetical protein
MISKFYEFKIDIFSRVSKSIMLQNDCFSVELPWGTSIGKSKNSSLNINYMFEFLNGEKNITEIILNISPEYGKTTYDFIEQNKKPKLSIVRDVAETI